MSARSEDLLDLVSALLQQVDYAFVTHHVAGSYDDKTTLARLQALLRTVSHARIAIGVDALRVFGIILEQRRLECIQLRKRPKSAVLIA